MSKLLYIHKPSLTATVAYNPHPDVEKKETNYMRITKKQVEVWIKNVAELTGRPVSNYDKTKDTYIVNSLYLDSYAPSLYNVYEIIDSNGCVNQFASGKLSDILEYLRAYYFGYKDALKNNENHPQHLVEGN